MNVSFWANILLVRQLPFPVPAVCQTAKLSCLPNATLSDNFQTPSASPAPAHQSQRCNSRPPCDCSSFIEAVNSASSSSSFMSSLNVSTKRHTSFSFDSKDRIFSSSQFHHLIFCSLSMISFRNRCLMPRASFLSFSPRPRRYFAPQEQTPSY